MLAQSHLRASAAAALSRQVGGGISKGQLGVGEGFGVGPYFAVKGLNFFRYFAGKGAKFRENFAEISKFR